MAVSVEKTQGNCITARGLLPDLGRCRAGDARGFARPAGHGRPVAAPAPAEAGPAGTLHPGDEVVGTDEAVNTSTAVVADRARIVTLVAVRRGFELGLKVLGGAPGALAA
jgi:hypothetical protein